MPRNIVPDDLGIEGPCSLSVCLVEDVVTSGGAAVEAVEALREAGLEVQQLALAGEAPAIAREAPVRADDAVARHDDADRIGAIGKAHGPHRLRLTYLPREGTIAERFARRNCAQRMPDLVLEGRAGEGDDHLEENTQAQRDI